MTPYKSSSGKVSGVTAYEITEDGIIIQFQQRRCYLYTMASCGRWHLERMKELAMQQLGLSTYVAQEGPGYARKREGAGCCGAF